MRTRQAACSATGASVHDEGDNEAASVSIDNGHTLDATPNVPVETQDFSENENEDHADEDPRLAHERAHALYQSASGVVQS